MPPKVLMLVYPDRQDVVPLRADEDWVETACATCEKRLSEERVIFYVDGEVRCSECMESKAQPAQCIWCGRPASRVQDTGHRMCQPCWTIYVAYVADEVEPADTPFKQLLSDVRTILKENQLGPEVPDHLTEVAQARAEWDATDPSDRPEPPTD